MLYRYLLFILLAVVCLACSTGSDTVAPASPAVGTATVFKVLPPTTDPNISIVYSNFLDSNFAYINRSVAARGRLLVFFPGTGATPRSYRLVLNEAASQGYHAIGLTYYNPNAIGDLCNQGGNTNLDCGGQARFEVVTGTDSSALLSVNVANSVDNRLLKMLQWLQTQSPQDNWAQFYPGGVVDWSKISASGHSQGGGLALYLGKLRNCLRISAFASGGDYNTALLTAQNWVRRPSITPATNYYGLASTADELVGVSTINALWQFQGMGTTTSDINIDVASPPYSNSRRLFTSATPRPFPLVVGPNHNVMVVDVNTPLDANGRPTLAPAWRYLCLP